MPDTLLSESRSSGARSHVDPRLEAAAALRRAMALVERDVKKADAHASLTSGEYHAAAMLLTAEAYTALREAASLYDRA